MANTFLVAGDSGSGKTTSMGGIPELGIKGLDPAKTVLINAMGKPLPFKGSRTQYNPAVKISEGGNYLATTDVPTMLKVLEHVNKNRPEITNVVVDD